MALTKVKINLGTEGNLSGSRSIIQSTKTLVSSSAQIASNISGSITSVSSSTATRIAANLASINTLNGSGTAQGVGTSDSPTFNDVTVTGTLTAQEVHTEFESASVIFTSGSTIFGNSSDDVHNMTGSLNISGSLFVKDGTLTVTDNVDFNGDLDVDGTTNLDNTDIDGTLTVAGGVARFSRADTTPAGTDPHGIFDDGVFGSTDTTNTGITIFGAEQTSLAFGDAGDSDIGQVRYQHTTNKLEFMAAAGIRMVVSGSGNVGIGTSSPDALLQISGSGLNGAPTLAIDNTSNSSYIHSIEALGPGMSSGQNNIINLGKIGSTKNSAIFGYKWDSAGSDDNLLTLEHWGTGPLVVLDGAGNLGIGTTAPDARLKVEEDTHGANVQIKMRAQNDSGAGRTFAITADPDARSITMGEAGQFVIKSNGATTDNVGIGVVPEDTNTNHSCLQIGGNGSILSYRAQGASGEMDINHNVFYNQAGNYTYLSTDEATRYRQSSGKHYFYVAASGTAGNTISFTEAMEIDNAGEAFFKGGTDYTAEFQGDVKILDNNSDPRLLIGDSTSGDDYGEISWDSSDSLMKLGVQGQEGSIFMDDAGRVQFKKLPYRVNTEQQNQMNLIAAYHFDHPGTDSVSTFDFNPPLDLGLAQTGGSFFVKISGWMLDRFFGLVTYRNNGGVGDINSGDMVLDTIVNDGFSVSISSPTGNLIRFQVSGHHNNNHGFNFFAFTAPPVT